MHVISSSHEIGTLTGSQERALVEYGAITPLPRGQEYVDKDLPLPRRLAHPGDVAVGRSSNQKIGNAPTESFRFGPTQGSSNWHNNMKPFTAGGLTKGSQAQVFQKQLYFLGGGNQMRPIDGRIRIEIENEPVRLFEGVRLGTPQMDFENTHLNQRDEPRQIIKGQVFHHLLLLADLEAW